MIFELADPHGALRAAVWSPLAVQRLHGPPAFGGFGGSGGGAPESVITALAVVEGVQIGDEELVMAARPSWRERDRCGECRRRNPGFDHRPSAGPSAASAPIRST